MDDIISAVSDVIVKAREMSAVCKEYQDTVINLEKMVTSERRLVEHTVYIQFEAEVPEILYKIRDQYTKAYRKFIQLVDILKEWHGSMAKSVVEVRGEIVIEKVGESAPRLWIDLIKPNLCDILMAAIVEKYGRVISKIIEESRKKAKEVAEEYRMVAEIAAAIDAMLR
jgi:hypothetical protein